MKTTFVKFKPTTELVDFKESNTPIDIIRKMSYDEFIEKTWIWNFEKKQ